MITGQVGGNFLTSTFKSALHCCTCGPCYGEALHAGRSASFLTALLGLQGLKVIDNKQQMDAAISVLGSSAVR